MKWVCSADACNLCVGQRQFEQSAPRSPKAKYILYCDMDLLTPRKMKFLLTYDTKTHLASLLNSGVSWQHTAPDYTWNCSSIWSKACSPACCQIPRERERTEWWPRLLLLPSSISFLHMGDWGVMNAPHAGQDSQVRLSGLCSCLLETLFIFYQSRRITQNMSATTFRAHFSGDLQNVTRSVRRAVAPAVAAFQG